VVDRSDDPILDRRLSLLPLDERRSRLDLRRIMLDELSHADSGQLPNENPSLICAFAVRSVLPGSGLQRRHCLKACAPQLAAHGPTYATLLCCIAPVYVFAQQSGTNISMVTA